MDYEPDLLRKLKRQRSCWGNAFSALVGSQRQFAELQAKQEKERRLLGKRIRDRADELTKLIRAEHVRKLGQLRDKQGRELHEQQMKHARESQELAKEIKEGRDRQLFEKEEAARKKRELAEQKQDVTKPTERQPESSLRAKFRQSRGQSRSGAERNQPASKTESLAGQFKETKEGIEQDKQRSFRQNADEIGRDAGRERSRKPQGPESKPD